MDDFLKGDSTTWSVALTPKFRLLIVGAGGHGLSVSDTAELAGTFDVIRI